VTRFLERQAGSQGLSSIDEEEVDRFAGIALNGREVRCPYGRRDMTYIGGLQIKNIIAIAGNLVAADARMSSSHISEALAANGDMVSELADVSTDDSLYD
jgi:hypothetical protein